MLAGMIIKILKVIGIIFIVLLIIDIISLILFNVIKTEHKVYNEKTSISLKCSLNNKEYEYIISYDNDDNILDQSGSEFIKNILDQKEFKSSQDIVNYIESYFNNNGGSCK